jgi:hypothetical protein
VDNEEEFEGQKAKDLLQGHQPRVEGLLTKMAESGGGPDTGGMNLDKLRPLGHAVRILSVIRTASLIFYNSFTCTVIGYSIIIIDQMIPIVLGDVSEDTLVAVLRALEFTQDEADELISLTGLTRSCLTSSGGAVSAPETPCEVPSAQLELLFL